MNTKISKMIVQNKQLLDVFVSIYPSLSLAFSIFYWVLSTLLLSSSIIFKSVSSSLLITYPMFLILVTLLKS